jgi:hypothetical protein
MAQPVRNVHRLPVAAAGNVAAVARAGNGNPHVRQRFAPPVPVLLILALFDNPERKYGS